MPVEEGPLADQSSSSGHVIAVYSNPIDHVCLLCAADEYAVEAYSQTDDPHEKPNYPLLLFFLQRQVSQMVHSYTIITTRTVCTSYLQRSESDCCNFVHLFAHWILECCRY